jgi:hypothetical protein
MWSACILAVALAAHASVSGVARDPAPIHPPSADVEPYCPSDEPSQPHLGYVYPVDPNGSLITVDLPELTLGRAVALDGGYVTVLNGSGPNAPSTSYCGDFLYAPSDTHFAEVNTYYHATKFLGEFLPARGFTGLGYVLPITVNHGGPPETGGCYIGFVPSTDSLYFCGPDGSDPRFPQVTMSADLIVRETAHAVTASLGVLPNGFGHEDQALVEGLGDYWAAAYTSDPHVGEYFFQFMCAATGGQWVDSDPAVFNYDNFGHVASCQYPAGSDIPNGMILNGALWDLRSHLADPTLADVLVLDALKNYFPHGGMTGYFPGFAVMSDAIRMADVHHHAGGELAAIDSAFARRRIHANPSISVDGPSQLQIGLVGVFSASVPVSAIVPIVSYSWSKRHTAPSDAWTSLGSGSSVSTSDTANFEVRVVATDEFGRVFEGSRAVQALHGPDPTVSIQGDASTSAFSPYHASTVATGVGLSYAWRRRNWLPEGPTGGNWSSYVSVGGNTPTLDDTTGSSDMGLAVTVTDIDGRTASGIKTITVTGGNLVARPPDVLSLASMSPGQVRVELSPRVTGNYTITIHDLSGRRIRTVFNGMLTASRQSVTLSTVDLQSGVYFCRLSGPGLSETKRFSVLH